MLILALDLGRVAGFAFGHAGERPASGSWELRPPEADFHIEPGELVRRILALTKGQRPDLVAVEDYMNPQAQKDQRALIAQLISHGAVLSWAGVSRIPLVRIAVNSCRTHVCGRASAGGRDASKAMVRDRMIALGLAPAGTTDTDRTDALCVWKWAEDVHADVRGSFALVAG